MNIQPTTVPAGLPKKLEAFVKEALPAKFLARYKTDVRAFAGLDSEAFEKTSYDSLALELVRRLDLSAATEIRIAAVPGKKPGVIYRRNQHPECFRVPARAKRAKAA
jgi:hypothetical protein